MMDRPRVSFLAFDGCPLAPRALDNLLAAICLLDSEIPVDFERIDLLSDSTPNEVKRWGSPTILSNGADITGHGKGDACSCRIYSSQGGVPSMDDILNAIRNADSIGSGTLL